jgi:hypothetical protein
MPSHATETDAADAPEPVPQTAKVGRWRLRPSLVAAVAFALGATTLLFLQSGDLFGRQREASAWVAHTHEILDVVTVSVS